VKEQFNVLQQFLSSFEQYSSTMEKRKIFIIDDEEQSRSPVKRPALKTRLRLILEPLKNYTFKKYFAIPTAVSATLKNGSQLTGRLRTGNWKNMRLLQMARAR
jgi:hypothetical protein